MLVKLVFGEGNPQCIMLCFCESRNVVLQLTGNACKEPRENYKVSTCSLFNFHLKLTKEMNKMKTSHLLSTFSALKLVQVALNKTCMYLLFCCSWTPWSFRIPCYIEEFKTIYLRIALQSFTIGYMQFELLFVSPESSNQWGSSVFSQQTTCSVPGLSGK